MTHTLIIPLFRPTPLNQLLGHWARGGRLKKHDRAIVAAEAWSQQIPKAQGKRRVSLEVTNAGRYRRVDPDAFFKSLLDALVACGLLMDDSPRWCELGTVTQRRGKRLETRIVLEDCP